MPRRSAGRNRSPRTRSRSPTTSTASTTSARFSDPSRKHSVSVCAARRNRCSRAACTFSEWTRRSECRVTDSMRVGMLTGGGDCPGLNAVIRAVCRRLWENGHETVAVLNGWRGMVDTDLKPLGWDEISGILPKGGTIIGTSRTNPYKLDGGVDGVKKTFEQLDALVAIGGEDTLGVASKLFSEFDLPVVGVPKTIDNDLNGTDYTFGFDTAVHVATEAVDRVHSTAESHNRIIVVETMGRHAGWIALFAGIAGGADYIFIPEQKVDYDAAAAAVERRHARGKNFSIVVISEGCELPGVHDTGEVDQF